MIQEEDMTLYKEMFIDLLTDGNHKTCKIVNKTLKVILTNWINNYQLKAMETPVSDG